MSLKSMLKGGCKKVFLVAHLLDFIFFGLRMQGPSPPAAFTFVGFTLRCVYSVIELTPVLIDGTL